MYDIAVFDLDFTHILLCDKAYDYIKSNCIGRTAYVYKLDIPLSNINNLGIGHSRHLPEYTYDEEIPSYTTTSIVINDKIFSRYVIKVSGLEVRRIYSLHKDKDRGIFSKIMYSDDEYLAKKKDFLNNNNLLSKK